MSQSRVIPFIVAVLGIIVFSSFVRAQPPEASATISNTASTISANDRNALVFQLGKVFTYFIVMLGPMKLIGPFSKMTQGMDLRQVRKSALKGVGFACVGGLVAALLGQGTLTKWGVSLPALLLAAGVVLLLVALKAVLSQYETPATRTDDSIPVSANIAFSPLAFPTIITPYGMAGLILLLAASPDVSHDLEILGVFFVVMAMNLFAMWYIRPIIKYGAGLLALLGSVLGVLQVALAIQMILLALRLLGTIPAIAG